MRGTLFTLLVCNTSHLMQRNSKLISHCSNYSESSRGLNRNSSGKTWMFREITRQQGKAVPAAASHLCRGGSSGGSVRTRVQKSKHFGIWLLVFWYFGRGALTWCTAVHLPSWKTQSCVFQTALMDWKNWQTKVRHVASVISTLIPGVEKNERTL